MGQTKRFKRFKLDTVVVGTGADCPKCGGPMQRRRHADEFKPPPGLRYWYAWWDVCRNCRHTQHYEEAKQLRDATNGEKIGSADPEDALNAILRARVGADERTTLPTEPVAIALLLRQLYGPEECAQMIETLSSVT